MAVGSLVDASQFVIRCVTMQDMKTTTNHMTDTLIDALRLAIKDTHRRESHTKYSYKAGAIQRERESYVKALHDLQAPSEHTTR